MPEHSRPSATFESHERRFLLTVCGIGPGVLARLEACGYNSLERIREVGVPMVVEKVVSVVGSRAWGNRRRALERALRAASREVS